MSTLEELRLEEKEISICMIPMNILGQNETEIEIKDNQMGVYIPKLMSSLPSEKPKDERVNIDYTIIKNLKLPKKKLISCNYLLVEPYTENNLSPQLFTVGEKCFTKFMYKDIKRAYFTSDKLSNDIEKTQDIKSMTVKSNNDIYEFTLDSVNNQIKVGNKFRQIIIDDNNNSISLSNQGSQIILNNDSVNIQSSDLNLIGEISINGMNLETMIRNIVKESIDEEKEVN